MMDPSVDGPVLNPKVLLSFSIIGVIGGVFLFDGFWGYGERKDLILWSVVAGLTIVGVAFWMGWGRLTATIGLIFSASVLACLGCELVLYFGIADPMVPEDWRGFERRIMTSWPKLVDPDKQEGDFRILGVSDSFGMTGGLKNYHWFLIDSLQSKRVPASLVNFSVSGYQPIHELEVVKRFAATYHPDLVLHGFYAGNDFQDVGGDRVFINGLYLHRFTDIRAFRPMYFLFFKWIRWQVKLTGEALLSGHNSIAKSQSEFLTERELMKVELSSLLSCALDAPSRMKWDDTLQIIHGIQEEAAKLGARYVMVIHPDRCQVEPAFRSRIMEAFQLNPETFDLELPQRYLVEDCNRLGIPCLDLLPAFRERGSDGGLYLPIDTHWNDNGNQLAAECIEEFLLSHDLVPLPKDE